MIPPVSTPSGSLRLLTSRCLPLKYRAWTQTSFATLCFVHLVPQSRNNTIGQRKSWITSFHSHMTWGHLLMTCEIFSVCVGLIEDHVIYFHNHLWIACHVPGKLLRWEGKIELLSLGGCVERWNKCSVKDHGQGQDRKKAHPGSSGLTLSVSGRWDCLGFAERAIHLAKEWVGKHPHRMRNVPGLGL